MIDVSLVLQPDGGWLATCAALEDRAPVSALAPTALEAAAGARELAQADVLAAAALAGVPVTPAGLVAVELRLREACTIALARLTPATIAAATGLGLDVSTFPDLDPELRSISGQRAVGEAVARRWLTPLGGLVDDPEYGGEDLGSLLGATRTADELAALGASLERQALEDERVESCRVVVTTTGPLSGQTLIVRAQLTTSEGPFSLVLTADRLAVSLDLLKS
jgi:hypothetical protein